MIMMMVAVKMIMIKKDVFLETPAPHPSSSSVISVTRLSSQSGQHFFLLKCLTLGVWWIPHVNNVLCIDQKLEEKLKFTDRHAHGWTDK